MYRHVILIVVYKSMYLYVGMLNYGTLKHMSSLHTDWDMKSFLCMLDLQMVIEVLVHVGCYIACD